MAVGGVAVLRLLLLRLLLLERIIPDVVADASSNNSSSTGGNSSSGTFDVLTFGADASGREPSDSAINAAIAAINERGGSSTLLFAPGQYKVLAPLTVLRGSDITVLGHGAHIQWMSTTHHQSCLTFGAVSTTIVALRGDVSRGADALLVVAPPGVLTERTLLRLNSSEVFYHTTADSTRNNKKGELLSFGLVSPANLTGTVRASVYGKGPLFQYAANMTTATAIVPSRNINVLGLGLTGRGAIHQNTGLHFDSVQGLLVSGVKLDAVDVGVALASCKSCTIAANSFSDINMVGLGYSIMIGTFCLGVDVTGNVGDKGRHFVTTGGEDGVSRDITITGNTFRGSIEGAISPHAQGYDVSIIGNHISDSWIGIASRSPNTIIQGNTVLNWGQPNSSVVVPPQRMQIAIYTTELGSINTVIQGNTLLYDAARWAGVVNGPHGPAQLYGYAICITGLPDDTGRVEFDNQHGTCASAAEQD